MKLALIGSVGVPNRYGGFESFAEHISPALVSQGCAVVVTCDASVYGDDPSPEFGEVERRFLRIRANGALSPLHDLVAFLVTAWRVDRVLVLGVSGGIFFPLLRILSQWFGAAPFYVNIDGVEWRRLKFGPLKRLFLYVSDRLAQRFAYGVIYDNEGLRAYVHARRSAYIAYSGDHVASAAKHAPSSNPMGISPYALTVCRIEPENNCELLIKGFLASTLPRHVFVGNWAGSPYGRKLREKYGSESRLLLLDPVFEPARLHDLRAGCEVYLHGHSVGGTNPSLVEMLFYDCRILCFDCGFNRHTAGYSVDYFEDAVQLGTLLNSGTWTSDGGKCRATLRQRYSAATIARSILEFINTTDSPGSMAR